MIVDKKDKSKGKAPLESNYFITDDNRCSAQIIEFKLITEGLTNNVFDYEKLKFCQSFAKFNKSDFPLLISTSLSVIGEQSNSHEYLAFSYVNYPNNTISYFKNNLDFSKIYKKFNPFNETKQITMKLQDSIDIEFNDFF